MENELNGKFIYIGIPTRGQINCFLCQWLMDTTKQPFQGYGFAFNFRKQDPTDCNRNEIVKAFLCDRRNEWLLFLDDDMIPKVNLLEMINLGEKVVSGLTCIFQKEKPGPLLMRYVEGRTDLYRMMELMELSGESRLIEVDGIGGACLMIHRSVLEKIEPPWFEFVKNKDGTLAISEDYYFSKKIKDAGFKIFVDPESPVGHLKMMDIMEINHLLYQVKADDNIKIQDVDNVAMKKNIFGADYG